MLFFFHLFMGNSVPHVIVHKDLSLIVSTALYIKKIKLLKRKTKTNLIRSMFSLFTVNLQEIHLCLWLGVLSIYCLLSCQEVNASFPSPSLSGWALPNKDNFVLHRVCQGQVQYSKSVSIRPRKSWGSLSQCYTHTKKKSPPRPH